MEPSFPCKGSLSRTDDEWMSRSGCHGTHKRSQRSVGLYGVIPCRHKEPRFLMDNHSPHPLSPYHSLRPARKVYGWTSGTTHWCGGILVRERVRTEGSERLRIHYSFTTFSYVYTSPSFVFCLTL